MSFETLFFSYLLFLGLQLHSLPAAVWRILHVHSFELTGKSRYTNYFAFSSLVFLYILGMKQQILLRLDYRRIFFGQIKPTRNILAEYPI